MKFVLPFLLLFCIPLVGADVDYNATPPAWAVDDNRTDYNATAPAWAVDDNRTEAPLTEEADATTQTWSKLAITAGVGGVIIGLISLVLSISALVIAIRARKIAKSNSSNTESINSSGTGIS